MTGRVRQATEADIPEMMALWLSMRENRLLDPSQLTAEDCRRYVTRGHMWVWDEGGAIHGIPPARSISDGSGGVRPPSREGRGVGRALFVAARDALIAADFRTLRLGTDPDSRPARSIARRLARGGAYGGRRTDLELQRAADVMRVRHIRVEFSTIHLG